MKLLDIAHFLLSEWLWNVSWGWHHISINIVVMYLLFKWVVGMKTIPSLLFSFTSHVFAFAVYSLVVVGGIIYGAQLTYDPIAADMVKREQIMQAAMALALIYALLQGIYFLLLRKRYNLKIRGILTATLLSNLISALCVYLLLPARL